MGRAGLSGSVTSVGVDVTERQAELLIERVRVILRGIDKAEWEADDGWWETSGQSAFGALKLTEVEAAIKEMVG